MREGLLGGRSLQREVLAVALFLCLIFLLHRGSNASPVVAGLLGLISLIAIFAQACWAGFRSALASCLILVGYVWLVYHVQHFTTASIKPERANTALLSTAILFPIVAGIGGLLRRARVREQEAKALLWTSEEMRSLILDATHDAVIGIAPDRTICLWSPNAERLLGWSSQEAIGGLGEPYLRDFRTGGLIEATLTDKEGREIPVEMYIAEPPSTDSTRYLIFAHDISERKESERTIQELNANLERRVAERTRQLEAANEELSGFAYSVSHDLRAPLRSIVANSRIVLEDGKKLLGETEVERLLRLEASALKMAELIDSLLEYVRIGQKNLKLKDVDVSELACKIGEDLGAGREGTISIQPGMSVKGDPQMVELVLYNLLENAWKYVEPGHAPRVEVGVNDEGAIYVRDHGIGFDMSYVDKIWEPFERLHRDGDYPGTGIGLANSRRIVERHGGRMWAESSLGGGTTMYFDLGAQGNGKPPGLLTESKV